MAHHGKSATPETAEASDEDTVRAVFERVDGFDVINHSLAQRTVGKPELAAVDRAQELQWSFLGVDGDNPVIGSEGVGTHGLAELMVVRDTALVTEPAGACPCWHRQDVGNIALK